MNVLMVGVDKCRSGGMWSVADTYISNKVFRDNVNLAYVATSTGGNLIKRILKMITGYMQIAYILCFKKIDLVHIHMAEKGSVYRKGVVISAAKCLHKKVVVQMHAGPIMSWYNGLTKKKQSKVRKIFNKSDKFLVLGKYWLNEIRSIVPAEKIEILYNGSDCGKRNRYNENGKYIIFLGMITKKKGAYDLIDAVKMIDNFLSKEDIVLLCGLDEDGAAQNYINELHLEKRIKLTGWIDSEQKEEFLLNSKLCVLPSYFEGLSMTVIEAMCHGIPVVTTSISTMSELLGNDIELIVPGDVSGLAEKLVLLINNESLRLEQSNILYHRARRFFSTEANIENTLKIYKQCIEGRTI